MSYKISKFLNNFLDDNNLSVTEIAKKLNITHAYVSYVKNETKTASKKFLENLISAYPNLKKQKKELYEMLESDKKIEKLKNIEKTRKKIVGENKELDRVSKLNKRERMQLDEVLNGAIHFFNDENTSEEDKEKLHASLLEVYFYAKEKNKKKYKK